MKSKWTLIGLAIAAIVLLGAGIVYERGSLGWAQDIQSKAQATVTAVDQWERDKAEANAVIAEHFNARVDAAISDIPKEVCALFDVWKDSETSITDAEELVSESKSAYYAASLELRELGEQVDWRKSQLERATGGSTLADYSKEWRELEARRVELESSLESRIELATREHGERDYGLDLETYTETRTGVPNARGRLAKHVQEQEARYKVLFAEYEEAMRQRKSEAESALEELLPAFSEAERRLVDTESTFEDAQAAHERAVIASEDAQVAYVSRMERMG